MGNEKTSVFSNGMIWFGAAVSIAEILAGTLLAPLGFKKGLMAIISGHLIGGVLMYFTGLIGARTGKNAMETVKSSFGSKGGIFFSVLNIIQLVGWTAELCYLDVCDINIDIWKQLIYHKEKWISKSLKAFIDYVKEVEFSYDRNLLLP